MPDSCTAPQPITLDQNNDSLGKLQKYNSRPIRHHLMIALEQSITREQLFFKNLIQHSTRSPVGSFYTDLPILPHELADLEAKLQEKIYSYVKHRLGLYNGVLGDTLEAVRDSSKIDPERREIAGILIATNIQPQLPQDLNCYETMLAMDEDYIGKVLAHVLMSNQLATPTSHKNVHEPIEDLELQEMAANVRLTSFSLGCFSDTFMGYFQLAAQPLAGFVGLLYQINGTPEHHIEKLYRLCNLRQPDNPCFLQGLDCTAPDNRIVLDGLTLTALKNGKIKFSLSSEMAQRVGQAILPHLMHFKRSFL